MCWRAIAQVSPRFISQPLMIVNKPSGGGIPGRVDTVRARPDGYTLMINYGGGEDLVVPHQRALPYNVFTDLEAVCRMSVHSIVLAVPTDSPYKTLADLVRIGKGKEHMTAAVSIKGASVDLTFLLFAKAADIKLTTIPGSGGADAITKLIGGHVDFGGGHPGGAAPLQGGTPAGPRRGLRAAGSGHPRHPDLQGAGVRRGDGRVCQGDRRTEGDAKGGPDVFGAAVQGHCRRRRVQKIMKISASR